MSAKAEYIWQKRELPDAFQQAAGLASDIENSRLAAEFGYQQDNWFYYLDATWAFADTQGNDAGTIQAFAPGARYNYGPGWVYAEYLTQDGYIDRNGQVQEGDFSSFYLSIDYYF